MNMSYRFSYINNVLWTRLKNSPLWRGMRARVEILDSRPLYTEQKEEWEDKLSRLYWKWHDIAHGPQ